MSRHKIILLGAVVLAGLSACGHNDGDTKSATPPLRAEAPLLDFDVVSSAEQGGTVLMIIASDGRLIHKSALLSLPPKLYKSRGIVAYTYQDSSGIRLKAVNTLGESLPTEGQLLDEDSKVFISDSIVAFTANLPIAGKLIDGEKVSAWTSLNRRVFAVNRNGLTLTTAASMLAGTNGEESKFYITDKLIAFTGVLTQQGKFLRQEGDSKVFEAIPLGARLFTFTDDGRQLNTASIVLDVGTETRLLRSTAIIMNAPVFSQGKLLKEESGTKTYESVPAGRKTMVFNYDGSLAN